MSVQNGDRPIDAVNVETTWQSLVSRPGAQLIDVRTRAEWTYVGIPDLGATGKRAVLVEWQTFPDQTVDPRFVERLAGELKVLGAQLGKCRVSSQTAGYIDTSSLRPAGIGFGRRSDYLLLIVNAACEAAECVSPQGMELP